MIGAAAGAETASAVAAVGWLRFEIDACEFVPTGPEDVATCRLAVTGAVPETSSAEDSDVGGTSSAGAAVYV
jgi:hypothetical protein